MPVNRRGRCVSTWTPFLAAFASLAVGCTGDAPPPKVNGAKPADAAATSKTNPANPNSAPPKSADATAPPSAPKTDPAPVAATDPAPKTTDPASPAVTKRIIILTNGASPYWDVCRVGMQDAVKELKLKDAGLSADLQVNDGSPQGQINLLRQYGSQADVAAVGVSVIDADNAAVADELRKLQAKGIKVVAIDSDVNREKHSDARFAFLGTDNLAGGRALGLCAAQLRPQGGGYVTFVGRTGAQNARERIDGVKAGTGEKFVALDSMADDTDRTRARENVRNAILNHADKLTTLVGIWSYNAPAIVDVVKERNEKGKFHVVVFDAEPAAIAAMGEGRIDALVVQNPYRMGYDGVRLLKALVENDQATQLEMFPRVGASDGRIYDTGLKVVVPDEGSPIDPAAFPKGVEVLKLKDFKAWLDEYGLSAS